jgi:hypothetical protein
MRKLLKARYRTAVNLLEIRYQEYQSGRVSQDQLAEAFVRVRHAGLEMTDKPAERIAILELSVELAKEAEEAAENRFKAGRSGRGEVEIARLFRMDAEIALLREKRKGETPKPR